MSNNNAQQLGNELVDALLNLIDKFGLFTAILIGLALGIVHLIRKGFEKAVDEQVGAAFAKQAKQQELVNSYMNDIENVMTQLNQWMHGEEVNNLFSQGQDKSDILPLTKVFTKLEADKTILGQAYYTLLSKRAHIALAFANLDTSSPELYQQQYSSIMQDKNENTHAIEAHGRGSLTVLAGYVKSFLRNLLKYSLRAIQLFFVTVLIIVLYLFIEPYV